MVPNSCLGWGLRRGDSDFTDARWACQNVREKLAVLSQERTGASRSTEGR